MPSIGGIIRTVSSVAATVGLDVVGLAAQAVLDVNFTIYGGFPFGFYIRQPLPISQIQTNIVNFVAGGIPAPLRMRMEIENKLVEVPIIGMNGNRIQHLGRKAPRIIFEGEFLYPSADVAATTFAQMIRAKIALPFFTTLMPSFRMMKCRRFVYEPISGRSPGDLRYEIELIQDKERGFP